MNKAVLVAVALSALAFSSYGWAKGGGGHGGGRSSGHSSHSSSHSGSHAHSSRSGRTYHSTSGRSKSSGFKSSHTSSRAKSRATRVSPGDDHQVSGYYKKNGTYVSSYRATNANTTRNDNYSTRGNINPYTGTPGAKPRDGETTR